MKTLKQFKESLVIAEKEVKKFKVGKKGFEAKIVKSGSKFVAYIDGDKLDVFKSEKEAEKAIKDFTELMGK